MAVGNIRATRYNHNTEVDATWWRALLLPEDFEFRVELARYYRPVITHNCYASECYTLCHRTLATRNVRDCAWHEVFEQQPRLPLGLAKTRRMCLYVHTSFFVVLYILRNSEAISIVFVFNGSISIARLRWRELAVLKIQLELGIQILHSSQLSITKKKKMRLNISRGSPSSRLSSV